MQAEYNHNDFINTSEADKALLVKYFYKQRPDNAATKENGYPSFKDVAYIEIRIAGQRDPQACRPATEADKQRFPAHYKAFLDRVEAPLEGMPLTEWPQVTRSQVESLAFTGVKTVEQLASINDTNISNFMGGYALKAKAQKWLEMNSADTVDREKEEMRETIAAMQAQILALSADRAGVPAPPVEEAKVDLASELDSEEPKPKRKSRRKTATAE
jgi:hypothetical protein